MPAVVAFAIAAAPVAAVVVGGIAITESRKARKAGKSESKKARLQQQEQFGRELEAGEYFEELTKQQMELQAQSSNIKTLATLIEQRSQPPAQQLITLPATKEYSAVDQINQAIGKLFKG